MLQSIEVTSPARIIFKRFVLFVVVLTAIIAVVSNKPIRQLWAISELKSAVLSSEFDEASPFTDVHHAMHSVYDLNAGRTVTPLLANELKGRSARQQMKILEALIFFRRDISPAVPGLIEAFKGDDLREVERECIAMLIEYGDMNAASDCGASAYLNERKKQNILLTMDQETNSLAPGAAHP